MPPMSLLVSFSDAESDLHSKRPEAARSPILLLPGPSGPWCPWCPCFRRLRGSCCCLHLSTCLAHLSCIPGRAWVSACQFNEQPVDAPFLCAWVDAISGRGAFCGCNTAINSLAGYSMYPCKHDKFHKSGFLCGRCHVQEWLCTCMHGR